MNSNIEGPWCLSQSEYCHPVSYFKRIPSSISEILHESNTRIKRCYLSTDITKTAEQSGKFRRVLRKYALTIYCKIADTKPNQQQHMVRRGFLVLERVSGCRQTIDGDFSVAVGRNDQRRGGRCCVAVAQVFSNGSQCRPCSSFGPVVNSSLKCQHRDLNENRSSVSCGAKEELP